MSAFDFTCMASGDTLNPKRWIAHDHKGSFCGEFKNKYDAVKSVEAWNKHHVWGDVRMEWIAPAEDADDSNRGTYIIRLVGTRFQLSICSGWGSQELAGERMKLLCNAVAKHGLETVSEILFAAQTRFTEYGWLVRFEDQ